MNTETKQATKCVASRLPYNDFISFAEEVGKSGMNINDYLYKLIVERNDAPKEIIKEVIKEVPVVKIKYKDKIVPQIEYRDREVIKEIPIINEVIKEVPIIVHKEKIVYKDKIVPQIEYRDREVIKVEYKDREVIKEVPAENQEVIWKAKFQKLYGHNYERVIRDAFGKVYGNYVLLHCVPNIQYTHTHMYKAFEYLSINENEYLRYRVT